MALVAMASVLVAPPPSAASGTPLPNAGPCASPGAPHGCAPWVEARLRSTLDARFMLPDLVAREPTEVLALSGNLLHTTVIANDGVYALDVLGEATANPELWTASQCVSWLDGVCRARRPAGELLWHPAHGHWHVEGFARYELRQLDDGQPDRSPGGLIASSPKVSFCLMDSRRESGGGSSLGSSLYVTCTGVLQGISPGWADVYELDLAGQSLPLAGVADSRYALVITVDPFDLLLESNENNNTSFSVVEVSANGTTARVVADP